MLMVRSSIPDILPELSILPCYWIRLIQRIRLRMKRLRITKTWIEILGSSYIIIILETEDALNARQEGKTAAL